jgi:hypothetical protein
MKRFPKILMATCAAVAASSKTAIPATAPINCPSAVSGQMGYGQMDENTTGTRISTGQRAGMDRSL